MIKNGGYTYREIAYIIKQLLLALSALHENDIIHRDVKADNLLLYDIDVQSGPMIKLADFSFAKVIKEEGQEKLTLGSRLYMAPELIKKETYNEKVDIWAVGVLAFYLMTFGSYPFPGINKEVVDNKIKNFEPEMSKIVEIPQYNDARSFILKCLNKNAEERPSARDLLAEGEEGDNWIKSVDMHVSEDISSRIKTNLLQNTQISRFKRTMNSFISNILTKSQDAKQLGLLFEEMDTNKNGKLEWSEFEAGMSD